MTGYAIIKSGSKQYRVEAGDVVDVELFEGEKGGKVKFQDVLLVHDGKAAKVGAPLVQNAVVEGEIENQVRGPKVIAYKYKKRKNYRRKVGHRQDYARVKITKITAG